MAVLLEHTILRQLLAEQADGEHRLPTAASRIQSCRRSVVRPAVMPTKVPDSPTYCRHARRSCGARSHAEVKVAPLNAQLRIRVRTSFCATRGPSSERNHLDPRIGIPLSNFYQRRRRQHGTGPVADTRNSWNSRDARHSWFVWPHDRNHKSPSSNAYFPVSVKIPRRSTGRTVILSCHV